jgi:hypothetical protein
VGINVTHMLFFTLLGVKQNIVLHEPPTSLSWNTPLFLFFCACAINQTRHSPHSPSLISFSKLKTQSDYNEDKNHSSSSSSPSPSSMIPSSPHFQQLTTLVDNNINNNNGNTTTTTNNSNNDNNNNGQNNYKGKQRLEMSGLFLNDQQKQQNNSKQSKSQPSSQSLSTISNSDKNDQFKEQNIFEELYCFIVLLLEVLWDSLNTHYVVHIRVS